jgi:hypothetical protein
MSFGLPTPIFHSRTDTPSPLIQKRLRLESTAIGTQDAGEAAFDNCIRLPLNREGDVDMDVDMPNRFGGADSPMPDSGPIAIPALPNFCPERTPATDLLLATTSSQDPTRDGMARSLAKLNADSHAIRLRQAELEQTDKQTARTYRLAVESYEKWWGTYQTQQRAADPEWTVIPAFPVTAPKVVMFLDYETTRPKVNPISFSARNPL